jgi:hypothetical protein
MTENEVRRRLAELMEQGQVTEILSLGTVMCLLPVEEQRDNREGSVEIANGQPIKRETKSIRGVKREGPVADDDFMGRYKTRRLDNGKVEVDLTDD